MGRLCDRVQVDEETVLQTLRDLGSRARANLVTMGQLCEALKVSPQDLDNTLRSLEERGMVMCVPSAGPVAVMSIVEGPLVPRESS
jgi:DNA-binding MarR family transcriptional regulator